MGATIWVDVEGRAEDDVPSDNSIMLRLEEQLVKLAAKLGVAKLTDFYDYSEMEEQAAGALDEDDADEDGEGDDTDQAADSRGAWFEPAQALAAVRAIHDHLAQHPSDLGFTADASRAHWPGGVMEELRYCRGVLEAATAKGKRFRFLIVP